MESKVDPVTPYINGLIVQNNLLYTRGWEIELLFRIRTKLNMCTNSSTTCKQELYQFIKDIGSRNIAEIMRQERLEIAVTIGNKQHTTCKDVGSLSIFLDRYVRRKEEEIAHVERTKNIEKYLVALYDKVNGLLLKLDDDEDSEELS